MIERTFDDQDDDDESNLSPPFRFLSHLPLPHVIHLLDNTRILHHIFMLCFALVDSIRRDENAHASPRLLVFLSRRAPAKSSVQRRSIIKRVKQVYERCRHVCVSSRRM